MDQGKAHLARCLENKFMEEPMMHHGVVKEHVFDAYPKLNDKIQIEWDAIFGRAHTMHASPCTLITVRTDCCTL